MPVDVVIDRCSPPVIVHDDKLFLITHHYYIMPRSPYVYLASVNKRPISALKAFTRKRSSSRSYSK
jgi:hypothetical protein